MITHLQGKLARLDASVPCVELDVAGVRYEVLVPLFLWPEVQAAAGDEDLDAAREGAPELGLHIYYSASANQPVPVLVGFMRRAERDFFRKFITVEGVGPARAVKAMNVSVSTIARAVEQEDRATLSRLSGIGARTADKIIATLRGKVTAEAALHDGGIAQPVDPRRFEERRVVADAVETIVALGYPRADARRWVEDARAADPGLETLEAITMAVLRARGAQG
jgi:Holliday junction DNA helicase RuvA